jgi:putative phage-type endonuclease
MTSFITKIKDLITLYENWLSEPEDRVQMVQWRENAEELADAYEFTEAEEECVDALLDAYEEQFQAKMGLSSLHPMDCSSTLFVSDTSDPLHEQLTELLQRKQTEQRTPEWYRQMSEMISASEVGQLFAAPRQRGKLVVSKALPYVPRRQSLATYSDQMSPFDWGIRFEPVVKQIYEEKYGATIKELGRMAHPTHPTCTASPDGLVYESAHGARRGRLIEIKCPVSREINGTIPKDYYTQMQMQLHVTGLKQCDYVEAEFSSLYQQTSPKNGPTHYFGFIALLFVRDVPYRKEEETGDNEEKRGTSESTESVGHFEYRYSPLCVSGDWTPMVEETEEVLEIIPWRLMKWHEQVVVRSEEWWTALQPVLRTFWEDVARAKRGEFVVPESSRPSKKAKTIPDQKCLITIHKLPAEDSE